MARYRSSYTPRSVSRLEKNHKKRLVMVLVFTILIVYFLINWGLPALLGGLSVFNQFKPSTTNKIAVEDAAIAPPSLNIPYEATNTATIKITGFAQPDSKVELYFDDELKTVAQTNVEGKFSSDEIPLVIGTNNIYGQTVIEDAVANGTPKKSMPSKTIKVYYNNEKPKLEVTDPADGLQIKGGDKKVRVTGSTDPENTISVNNTTVIVNNEGKFTTEVSLTDGDNTITIVATNNVGNTTKQEKKVNYSPS